MKNVPKKIKRISMGKELKELKGIKVCSVSRCAAHYTSDLLNSTTQLVSSPNRAQIIAKTSLQNNKEHQFVIQSIQS